MRKKTLNKVTAAVIVILLVIILGWVLVRAFAEPDSRDNHDHSLHSMDDSGICDRASVFPNQNVFGM